MSDLKKALIETAIRARFQSIVNARVLEYLVEQLDIDEDEFCDLIEIESAMAIEEIEEVFGKGVVSRE